MADFYDPKEFNTLPQEKHDKWLKRVFEWCEDYDFFSFLDFVNTQNPEQRRELAKELHRQAIKFFYDYNGFDILPPSDFQRQVLFLGCAISFMHFEKGISYRTIQKEISPRMPLPKVCKLGNDFKTNKFAEELKRSAERLGL